MKTTTTATAATFGLDASLAFTARVIALLWKGTNAIDAGDFLAASDAFEVAADACEDAGRYALALSYRERAYGCRAEHAHPIGVSA